MPCPPTILHLVGANSARLRKGMWNGLEIRVAMELRFDPRALARARVVHLPSRCSDLCQKESLQKSWTLRVLLCRWCWVCDVECVMLGVWCRVCVGCVPLLPTLFNVLGVVGIVSGLPFVCPVFFPRAVRKAFCKGLAGASILAECLALKCFFGYVVSTALTCLSFGTFHALSFAPGALALKPLPRPSRSQGEHFIAKLFWAARCYLETIRTALGKPV